MNDLKQSKILVTRPAHQAEKLCDLITKNNGIPIRFPTIEIVPINLTSNEIKKHLIQAEIVIFTSANAVRLYCSQLDNAKMHQLKTKLCLAIGNATAKALETMGLNVDLIPERGYNSEALLEQEALQTVSQKNIVIVRGENGREILAEGLKNRGATVFYQNVYKRKIPDVDNTEILELLKQNRLNVVTVTSGEAVENLVKMLPQTQQDLLKKIPLVVVSERIQQIAKSLDFTQITLTNMPSDDAILNTTTTIIKRGRKWLN